MKKVLVNPPVKSAGGAVCRDAFHAYRRLGGNFAKQSKSQAKPRARV